jgi:hypothetical protein
VGRTDPVGPVAPRRVPARLFEKTGILLPITFVSWRTGGVVWRRARRPTEGARLLRPAHIGCEDVLWFATSASGSGMAAGPILADNGLVRPCPYRSQDLRGAIFVTSGDDDRKTSERAYAGEMAPKRANDMTRRPRRPHGSGEAVQENWAPAPVTLAVRAPDVRVPDKNKGRR